MYDFFGNKFSFAFQNLNLFQFAVLNPQIAMLSYLKLGEKMANQPEVMKKAHQDLLNRLLELQKEFIEELCKDNNDECLELSYNQLEKKFEDNSFENLPVIKFSQKFHEMFSAWILDTVSSVDDVDPKIMHSACFFLKQYTSMMSPTNFPFLNPSFLRETIASHGENIKNGLEMLMDDISNGSITTNDRTKFKIGENVAVTPGKVVYQNEIIELIQYSPSIKQVFSKPLLFVPPWINKFYILDITAEMSFVKWAVDKGFTVFIISWINPRKEHRHKGFEDYLLEGLLNSIDKIHELTKTPSVHAFGYCVGGTLISALLAYLAHPLCPIRPKAKIDTVTLLTTLLDFDKAGDMRIFMEEEYLEAIKVQLGDKGYLDGKVMFNTFNVLKSNDMIWRYFVNNYMLGKKPAPHEILYWNSDQTNITEAMQIFLSKDLYRDNLLKTGELKILGIPIDLTKITTPIYMVSMIKDHLVPWQATFDSLKIFKSNVRFVLGGSGHVAGAINPPSKNKYCYWINEKNTSTAEEWLETAVKFSGSWWNDWFEWIKPMSGKLIDSVDIKKFIRNAPGIYVNMDC
jgi:polyhydroxyalkanoate synthase